MVACKLRRRTEASEGRERGRRAAAPQQGGRGVGELQPPSRGGVNCSYCSGGRDDGRYR